MLEDFQLTNINQTALWKLTAIGDKIISWKAMTQIFFFSKNWTVENIVYGSAIV